MIPHSRPYVGASEALAAYEVVMSRQLAMGKKVEAVEKKWKCLTRSEDAVMVSSGLTALRLALKALKVSYGDEVIVPSYSCSALFNCVLQVGAEPILADIDGTTLCMKSVRKLVKKRTAAIIAVDLFGFHHPFTSSEGRGVPIIHDMAHSCRKLSGDIGISSFYPTKLFAGGGGIVFGDSIHTDTVWDARTYGDKPPSKRMNDQSNDIEAAIVLEQLNKRDEIMRLRNEAAKRYDEMLENYIVIGGNYRYIISVPNCHDVSRLMKAKGVHCEMPIWDYRSTYKLGEELKGTHNAFQTYLSLPIYPDITSDEQLRVVECLGEVVVK